MSRVKLTEYRAKKILLGESYRGVQVCVTNEKLSEKGSKKNRMLGAGKAALEAYRVYDESDAGIPQQRSRFFSELSLKGQWVAKVDQGIKKRMKQGLVAVGVDAAKARSAFAAWRKKGFSQFLVEPLFPHETSEEQYLSLERVREGIRLLHARDGGIDIESHPEAVSSVMIADDAAIAKAAKKTGLPEKFLSALIQKFNDNFFAFLEINPLVVRGDSAVPLDAAVLVDSAGTFFATEWSDKDVVRGAAQHETEERVTKLAATTPAQLALKVMNKDGALFFLFSGGGGSIVIADEAQLQGVGHMIGNYGEYSGGPTREETHLYAREVISLMLASKAKKKALVIAGGVANFTDIAKTFAGIIDALSENADKLRKQGIKVFVRRGGPNEKAGLYLMRAFLEKENLLGSIYGSDTVITKAVEDAIKMVTR